MAGNTHPQFRFFCPTHKLAFRSDVSRKVRCEIGEHLLCNDFPNGEWCEFCCDCGTFWPTDSVGGSLQRTECLVCERPLAKRYLCSKCQVVSIESSALVRRKTYSIQDSGITPDCPGCATAANGRLHEHDCTEANVRLLTSRSTCPFCETDLDAKKSSKPAPAATARVTVCPICDTQQKPGNLFCGRCGEALPVAVAQAKTKETTARRKAEETEARQQTTEARQRVAAEALRVAEEQSLREREAKRKAEEWRMAEAARQTADRQASTLAAAIAAGKKTYQEEKRKVQLAEEASRREEERQRRAKEAQRRAEEEAARQTAKEEARIAAELARKEEEARALAEQEQSRLEEAQRQQAEHERLATELHQRAKEEEEQRAKEAARTVSDQRSLTTPEPEHETELEDKTQPIAAADENQAQGVESQAENDESPSASADRDLAGEAVPDTAAQQPLQQTAEPGPIDHSTIDEPQSPHKNDSFSSPDNKSANEVVAAPEYVPYWDQPSTFTTPQPRRLARVWLVGLLVIVVIGVVLTVIATKQRVNTDDDASVRPTPAPTGPTVPVGMVRIPGGEFVVGSDRSNADQQEGPAHKATVAPFYIDTTEVTCEDYQKFVKATGHKPPASWTDGSCPSDEMRKPVTGVDWYDASAYAKWANKRLPTEEEWEFAARGTTGWIYPWGGLWQKGAANADKAAPGTVVVATFKATSPFQCYDMVGNAWEWTASKLVPYPGGKLGQEVGADLRVIRGGSWQSDKDSATTTYRCGWPASGGKDYSNTSFRCAQDVKPAEPAPVVSR